MRTNALLICLSVCLFCFGCVSEDEETPLRGKLHVVVCESQAKVMATEAREFMRLYPNAHITWSVMTTREAIIQLVSGKVKFICIDRPLNSEEEAAATSAGLTVAKVHVAEDALAFLVNPANHLQHLTQQELKNIFTGATDTWDTVDSSGLHGAIERVMTGKNSGVHELFSRRFLNWNGDIPLSARADSQQQVLALVASQRQAIGVVSMGALSDTLRPLRVLRMESIDSTGVASFVRLHQANVYLETYKYHFPVYVCLTPKKTDLASGFSAFIGSAPGQKIFLNAGLVPVTMPVRLVHLNEQSTAE